MWASVNKLYVYTAEYLFGCGFISLKLWCSCDKLLDMTTLLIRVWYMALPHPSLGDFNFSNQPSSISKYTILACKLLNVKYEHRLHVYIPTCTFVHVG